MSKKEVKLKASILDLVGPLLKQLEKEVKSREIEKKEANNGETGKKEANNDEIEKKEANNDEIEKKEANNGETETALLETALKEIVESIEKLKTCLGNKERWENQLIGYIGKIERQIDRWTSESDENNKREIKRSKTTKVIKLKDKLNNLVQKPYDVPSKDYEENNKKVKDEVGSEVGASSSIDESMRDGVGFKELIECMKELNPQLRDCLYSLGIFPVNGKLKKRLLIYWWIGLGLVPLQGNKNRTAKQYAKILFDDLMDQGILIPDQTNNLLHNQAVKWCTIQPTIHKQLIKACERRRLVEPEKRKEGTVFFYGHADNNNNDAKVNNGALLNFNQQYLDSEDIKKIFEKYHTLQVLQFGWWREVLEHDQEGKKAGAQEQISEDHIEVDEIDFLKQIGGSVTYLSLRGISRVEELPKNVGKLEDLMILDLRACHNLEKLPEKPKSKLGDILKPKLPTIFKSKLQEAKWFKNLSHLDISECYLLDHMPKWICELSNLEVLKGFVAGSATRSKGHFCEISDLSKLKKLRKLSIKMAKLSKEGTIDMKHLERLSVLTITWKLDDRPDASSDSKSPSPKAERISFSENLEKMHIRSGSKSTSPKAEIISSSENLEKLDIRSGSKPTPPKAEMISFPKNLEKLDIRCYPNVELAQLIDQPTSGLKKLKRLYIRGGNLTKLIDPNDAAWTLSIEILRLRSLNLLELSLTDLGKKCKKLKCVEYLKCPKLEGFSKDKTCVNTQAINDEQEQLEQQICHRPGKGIMTEQPEKEIHMARDYMPQ